MTDIDYIKAFRENKQHLMTTFYTEKRESFMFGISQHFKLKNKDILAEIYQESIIRLWKNIQNGRLLEHQLSSTLDGYLYKIGEYVTLEMFRKDKKLQLSADDNLRDDITTKSLMLHNTDSFNIPIEMDEDEGRKKIRKLVNNMGAPCAPLLLCFYWDEKSWEEIALELGYKNANSAKTQKNKCMNKIKALLKK